MENIFEKGMQILDKQYMGTTISAYTKAIVNFNVGDIIDVKIAKIEKEEILVSLGGNMEGFIPLKELTDKDNAVAEEIVKIGDEIKAYILEIDDKDGRVILSKKKADEEIAWEKANKIYQEQKIINVSVERAVKGGLMSSVFGLPAFIPASLVDLQRVDDLNSYQNREIDVKIIELNRESKKIILSRRIVLEEEREKKKELLFSSLKEEDIREGEVIRIVPFGVFVDLGGVNGLIHISEMAWVRISHPGEIVKEGERVKVKILKIDKKNQKISLSIKQVIPDPWEYAESKFTIGKIIPGKVMRILNFGVFVRIDEQLEGLVHINELSNKKFNNPGEVISVGDEVMVKVIGLNKKERRISLSIKQVNQEEEKKRYQEYLLTQGTENGENPAMLEAFKEAMKEKEK